MMTASSTEGIVVHSNTQQLKTIGSLQSLKNKSKQAGAELGQAQLKLGLDLTSTSLY